MPGFLLGSRNASEVVALEMKDLENGTQKLWELKITASSYIPLLNVLDALYRRLTSHPYKYILDGASEKDTGKMGAKIYC